MKLLQPDATLRDSKEAPTDTANQSLYARREHP